MSGRPVSLINSTNVATGFRESVHLIPTPGVEDRRPPKYEALLLKLWMQGLIATLMIGLSVALEVALRISEKNNGFHVPAKNVFDASFISPQFLTSFFPTLLVAPLALLWGMTDWLIRWYQPYITLSGGSATADESLLLDYIALGNIFSISMAFKHKHWLIATTSITVFISYLLQPLAGSIFSVQQGNEASPAQVYTLAQLGTPDDASDLTAFISSAGFVDAAVINNLDDPPFICDGWATTPFTFPPTTQLGNMSVLTTGLQNFVNCGAHASITFTDSVISATSSAGCSGNVSLVSPSGTSPQQYGVIRLPDCGPANTPVTEQPVMFWFYHQQDPNAATAAVFCQPTIANYNVSAIAALNNGSLLEVQPLSGAAAKQSINGLFFENSTDPFINARALATQGLIPGAIFKAASLTDGGLESVFSDLNGFASITSHLYTQHLSLVAKSTFFVPANQTASATQITLVPRLVIQPLPARALSIIMFLLGVVGLVVQFLHRRERKNLYLTAPPGSIAAILSMTSRSGFGDLLLPYDDVPALKRKLAGLYFRLDRRTGAIVADDDGTGAVKLGPDDAMMTLLGGEGRERESTYAPSISVAHSDPSKATEYYNPYESSA